MASQSNNPYKRMKKALKGAKPTGETVHKMAMKSVKTAGKFQGKSNKLGQGGRAAQLKAQGVPGGVIGNLARAAQAAPGQKNFHKKTTKKKVAMPDKTNLGMMMKKKVADTYPSTAAKKSTKKGVVGMTGNKKMKSVVSMGGDKEMKSSKMMKSKKKSASK